MSSRPTISSVCLQRIPYLPDSLKHFHTIAAELPMPVILQSDISDGTSPQDSHGRFDILTADPEFWIETRGTSKTWHGRQQPHWQIGSLDSLGCLHRLLEDIHNTPVDYSSCEAAELPFCGGLIGYCSYDLARELLTFGSQAEKDIDLPEMQFGFFAWALVQDHRRQQAWLVIHPACSPVLRKKLEAWDFQPTQACDITIQTTSDRFKSNISQETYQRSIGVIDDYIHAGDCYQVNFSQRFTASLPKAKSLTLYQQLRQNIASPFSAYIPVLGDNNRAIISLSPERFIRLTTDGHAITQPIKGTAARYADTATDMKAAEALLNDPKNRAENIMIVDLLRNDLGKVCETGTIRVSELAEVHSFSNVHHLVSTITGKLKQGMNGADLLRACFPGGSITGAPKIRAMEIIEELEPQRRGIYCGSIVMFSANGYMDSNITIRTILVDGDKVHCWGGGGIVADSDPESEYQESITKVRNIMTRIGPSHHGEK